MGTILFADGSSEVRAMAILALAGSGCTALPVANGREALSLMARQRPDLVIAEVELPGIDGIALAWHIRSWFPDVPIVLMSAQLAEADLGHLRSLYDAFLPKPVSSRQLSALAIGLAEAGARRQPASAAAAAN